MTDTIKNGQPEALSDRSTAELAEKGKHAGLGAGLFGGGGLMAAYGLGALIATLVLALDIVLPAWLATLIVAVLRFAVAAVLALVGRAPVKQAVPPVPQDAVQGVKADIEAVTEAVRERGGK